MYFELVNNILNIDISKNTDKNVSFNELERFYNRFESSINEVNVNSGKEIVKYLDIWELQNVINN
jgi:hypothetical protein